MVVDEEFEDEHNLVTPPSLRLVAVGVDDHRDVVAVRPHAPDKLRGPPAVAAMGR